MTSSISQIDNVAISFVNNLRHFFLFFYGIKFGVNSSDNVHVFYKRVFHSVIFQFLKKSF